MLINRKQAIVIRRLGSDGEDDTWVCLHNPYTGFVDGLSDESEQTRHDRRRYALGMLAAKREVTGTVEGPPVKGSWGSMEASTTAIVPLMTLTDLVPTGGGVGKRGVLAQEEVKVGGWQLNLVGGDCLSPL